MIVSLYGIGLLTSFVIGMKVISIYENILARFAFNTNNLWRYQTFFAHDQLTARYRTTRRSDQFSIVGNESCRLYHKNHTRQLHPIPHPVTLKSYQWKMGY